MRRKIRALLSGARRLDWSLVAMILAVKTLIFVFGVMAYEMLADQRIEGQQGWLKIWNRWDALHYQTLAEYGYQATGEARFTLVYFPLYPWLIRLLALVSGNYLLSAIIVSGIASIAAGLLLRRLVQLDHSREIAQRAVFFLFIFPASYFLHIGYTESLFLAFALGCLLAARAGRWPVAGALGALASLTRVNGLILIPALMVEAIQAYRTTRRWQWEWLWIVAVAAGFSGHLLINAHVTGDPFAFLTIAREHYYKSLAWPWVGLRVAIEAMRGTSYWGRTPALTQLYGVQELVFTALAVICTIWCWAKLRPVYTAWMIGNLLLFICNSWVLSMPRFMLVMFPIFILFARLSANRFWNSVITTWSLLFLALFSGLFIQGHWAF